MGLLSSLIAFTFVVSAGWFTIHYLVPKLEGTTNTTTTTTTTPANVKKENEPESDITKVLEEITSAITGDTTPAAKKEMRFIELWAY